jgi:hypothetical protein
MCFFFFFQTDSIVQGVVIFQGKTHKTPPRTFFQQTILKNAKTLFFCMPILFQSPGVFY